jgi:hypothetical protein
MQSSCSPRNREIPDWKGGFRKERLTQTPALLMCSFQNLFSVQPVNGSAIPGNRAEVDSQAMVF